MIYFQLGKYAISQLLRFLENLKAFKIVKYMGAQCP
jgi:hypothetical protein